jgi:histone deacetylase complex regulatory component SIN3
MTWRQVGDIDAYPTIYHEGMAWSIVWFLISIYLSTDLSTDLSNYLYLYLYMALARQSVFYGNDTAYVFLRLYHLLHSRLEQARDLCERAKRNRNRRIINPAARALAHAHHMQNHEETINQTGDYEAFISKLYALIDNSIDTTRYEDCCRSLMGSSSYFLFTLDKLVQQLLKQMQHLANDDMCQALQVRRPSCE